MLGLAAAWVEGERPANRLLSGADIAEAKAWVTRQPKAGLEPGSLILDFVRASEEWATHQESEEYRRREERERLVKDRETAQAERDADTRRVVQRTLMGLVAALLFALLAGGAGVYAFFQRQDAVLQRQDAFLQKQQAETGRAAAEAATKEAQLTQSRFLTGLADQAIKEGDATTGMLLALKHCPTRIATMN